MVVVYDANGLSVVHSNGQRGPRFIMGIGLSHSEEDIPLEYNSFLNGFVSTEAAEKYFVANPNRTVSWEDGESLIRVKDGTGWEKEGF
tara:strand:- start:522 stop:785 length:264 start_codon:yes stop_codon:yes gene_type:complete